MAVIYGPSHPPRTPESPDFRARDFVKAATPGTYGRDTVLVDVYECVVHPRVLTFVFSDGGDQTYLS